MGGTSAPDPNPLPPRLSSLTGPYPVSLLRSPRTLSVPPVPTFALNLLLPRPRPPYRRSRPVSGVPCTDNEIEVGVKRVWRLKTLRVLNLSIQDFWA